MPIWIEGQKKDACLLFINHIWTETHEHTNRHFHVYWVMKHGSVLFILIWNIVPKLQHFNNQHLLNRNIQISSYKPTWSELKCFERVTVIGFEMNYVLKASGTNQALHSKCNSLSLYMLELIVSLLINKGCIYGSVCSK